jgi:hypothetical protein
MRIVNRVVPEESSIERRAFHTIIVEQRFAAAARRRRAVGRHLSFDSRVPKRRYVGPLVLFTKVIAGRLGSGFDGFFFGFLTSRLRASLFPMPDRMPQFRSCCDILRELARLGFSQRRPNCLVTLWLPANMALDFTQSKL